MLEQIERGNLFLIPLDDERYWYRYHHLFGDMLRRQLEYQHPELVTELQRRASVWFEASGWNAEAVEHAFAAKDDERAARLVASYGFDVWSRGGASTFLRWLEQLPSKALQQYPKLGLNYALLLGIIDDFVGAEAQLSLVEAVLPESANSADAARYAMLLGQAGAIRTTVSLMLEYPWQAIVEAGEKALARLPQDNPQWRGWITELVGCAYYAVKGDMANGERCFEEALALSIQVNDVFNIMMTMTHTCRMYMNQGRLSDAGALAERLLRLGDDPDWTGQPAVGLALLDRSRVRYERNDLAGALEDVVAGREYIEGFLLKRGTIDANLGLAILKQRLGETDEARHLLEQTVDLIHKHELKQDLYAGIGLAAAFLVGVGGTGRRCGLGGADRAARRWSLGWRDRA